MDLKGIVPFILKKKKKMRINDYQLEKQKENIFILPWE